MCLILTHTLQNYLKSPQVRPNKSFLFYFLHSFLSLTLSFLEFSAPLHNFLLHFIIFFPSRLSFPLIPNSKLNPLTIFPVFILLWTSSSKFFAFCLLFANPSTLLKRLKLIGTHQHLWSLTYVEGLLLLRILSNLHKYF